MAFRPIKSQQEAVDQPSRERSATSTHERATFRSGALCAASICLALAVGALYEEATKHEFISLDDRAYVTENPHVAAGVTWDGVKWAFSQSHASNYHPITWLSHMLDCQIFGLDAAGHHLSNVLLHITNSVLLLASLYLLTQALGPSIVVAVLFAFHPLRVESVAWIAERKDVLSGLFWLATILAYTWYASAPRLSRYVAVLVLFSLGLLAKQMLVTLPLILLLLDIWPLGRWKRWSQTSDYAEKTCYPTASTLQLLMEKVPLLAMSFLFSAIVVLSQREGAISDLEALPLGARTANAAVSYGDYLWKTFWPHQLSVFYPHPALVAPGDLNDLWQAAGFCALLLLAITAVVAYSARQRPYLAVGWGWYLIGMLPVIGFVQVGLQGMADRYTYLPLIGIYIMLSWGAAELLERTPWGRWVGGILFMITVIYLSSSTSSYLKKWRNSETLYLHALKTSESNYYVHDLLGIEYGEQGKNALAEEHFRHSLRIKADYHYAHTNLGTILAQQGRLQEAETHWLAALAAEPDFFDAHKNLGVLSMQLKRPNRAVEHFLRAINERPEDQTLYRSLASQYTILALPDQAIEAMQTALSFDPRDVESLSFLAAILMECGRPVEAKTLFQQLLEIEPQDLSARESIERIDTLQTESAEKENP